MKQRNGGFGSLPSPLHLFFIVLAIVFLAEAAVTFLLDVLLPETHTVAKPIADASLLIALSGPFLWWFVARPLRSTAVAEHGRAEAVVEHALDGIITLNEEGLVESFNPAAEQIFGYRGGESKHFLPAGWRPVPPISSRLRVSCRSSRGGLEGERTLVGRLP